MYETIRLFYGYNSWAMDVLFNALEKLNTEQYNAPGCSGRGSIKETLAHLMSTQMGWFAWFDGSKSQEEAMKMKVKEQEAATVSEARKKWNAIDHQAQLFLDILTEEALTVHRSFILPGTAEAASLPLGKILLHVANHGTHTRAQIVAAIRRAGIDPGSYEMLRFLLARRAAKVS